MQNPQVGYVKATEAWDLNVRIQKFPEEIFALQETHIQFH